LKLGRIRKNQSRTILRHCHSIYLDGLWKEVKHFEINGLVAETVNEYLQNRKHDTEMLGLKPLIIGKLKGRKLGL
jgi:hypothetical protein